MLKSVPFLPWCFECIKYPDGALPKSHVSDLCAFLRSEEAKSVVEVLQSRVVDHLSAQASEKWAVEVARNVNELMAFENFGAALLRYVHRQAQQTVAMLIFQLERLSALSCYQTLHKTKQYELCKAWEDIVRDSGMNAVVDISDLALPQGAECYSITDCYDGLCFPFSFVIVSKLEEYRTVFDQIDAEGTMASVQLRSSIEGFLRSELPFCAEQWVTTHMNAYLSDFLKIKQVDLGTQEETEFLKKMLLKQDFDDPIEIQLFWWQDEETVVPQTQLLLAYTKISKLSVGVAVEQLDAGRSGFLQTLIKKALQAHLPKEEVLGSFGEDWGRYAAELTNVTRCVDLLQTASTDTNSDPDAAQYLEILKICLDFVKLLPQWPQKKGSGSAGKLALTTRKLQEDFLRSLHRDAVHEQQTVELVRQMLKSADAPKPIIEEFALGFVRRALLGPRSAENIGGLLGLLPDCCASADSPILQHILHDVIDEATKVCPPEVVLEQLLTQSPGLPKEWQGMSEFLSQISLAHPLVVAMCDAVHLRYWNAKMNEACSSTSRDLLVQLLGQFSSSRRFLESSFQLGVKPHNNLATVLAVAFARTVARAGGAALVPRWNLLRNRFQPPSDETEQSGQHDFATVLQHDSRNVRVIQELRVFFANVVDQEHPLIHMCRSLVLKEVRQLSGVGFQRLKGLIDTADSDIAVWMRAQSVWQPAIVDVLIAGSNPFVSTASLLQAWRQLRTSLNAENFEAKNDPFVKLIQQAPEVALQAALAQKHFPDMFPARSATSPQAQPSSASASASASGDPAGLWAPANLSNLFSADNKSKLISLLASSQLVGVSPACATAMVCILRDQWPGYTPFLSPEACKQDPIGRVALHLVSVLFGKACQYSPLLAYATRPADIKTEFMLGIGADRAGYMPESSDLGKLSILRALRPVSRAMLRLFTHLCLLVCLEMQLHGASNTRVVMQSLGLRESEGLGEIHRQVRSEWEQLELLLGQAGEVLAGAIHAIIDQLPELHGRSTLPKAPLTTREGRQQWETEFNALVLKATGNTDAMRMCNNRVLVTLTVLGVLNAVPSAAENLTVAQALLKADLCELDLPSTTGPDTPSRPKELFRLIDCSEIRPVIFYEQLEQQRSKCPLLIFMRDHQQDLELSAHLADLVVWWRTVAQACEHKLSRAETKKLSIQEFIEKWPESQRKPRTAEAAAFVGAWNKCVEEWKLGASWIKDGWQSTQPSEIGTESPIFECCLLPKSWLWHCITRLAAVCSKNFVTAESILKQLQIEVPPRRSKRVFDISAAKEVRLESLEQSLSAELINFLLSHRDGAYGAGNTVTYHLAEFQYRYGKNYMSSVSRVIVPEKHERWFCFAGELFQGFASVFRDLQRKVPQRALSDADARGLALIPATAMGALGYLELLIRHLRDTAVDVQESLKLDDFAITLPEAVRSQVLGALKQTKIDSFHVGQIRALYELFEDSFAKKLITKPWAPYTWPETDLPPDVLAGMKSGLPLQYVISALQRFILRFLYEKTGPPETAPLRQYMTNEIWPLAMVESVMRSTDHQNAAATFLNFIPEQVKVGHSIAVYKYLERVLDERIALEQQANSIAQQSSHRATAATRPTTTKRTLRGMGRS
eukprot:TRINITY_DN234_c1_g1_i3.p1 TRINITY_DN234_c1_g1~~TRINITY_DN234_c1_g1_i3.p1  ORF type:complete len:1716 (-),score=356.56 TRINITY_DN234_c1_g1_i3:13-4869(-)